MSWPGAQAKDILYDLDGADTHYGWGGNDALVGGLGTVAATGTTTHLTQMKLGLNVVPIFRRSHFSL
ncbi:Ca2+-binding RTX toxin-like protein [Novosphingobium sp. SG916]|nr:Ca2+-binding RTX toxin-like protein [Novosphingobium sp. SG919]NMN88470.1 Ca2+-binding RTX toxin-like protein [Novosphingobium sp. SG916]